MFQKQINRFNRNWFSTIKTWVISRMISFVCCVDFKLDSRKYFLHKINYVAHTCFNYCNHLFHCFMFWNWTLWRGATVWSKSRGTCALTSILRLWAYCSLHVWCVLIFQKLWLQCAILYDALKAKAIRFIIYCYSNVPNTACAFFIDERSEVFAVPFKETIKSVVAQIQIISFKTLLLCIPFLL